MNWLFFLLFAIQKTAKNPADLQTEIGYFLNPYKKRANFLLIINLNKAFLSLFRIIKNNLVSILLAYTFVPDKINTI